MRVHLPARGISTSCLHGLSLPTRFCSLEIAVSIRRLKLAHPSNSFKKHGMATVKLSEIVRQRKPELKRTVERLSAREMRAAIDSLEQQGRIKEISDTTKRLKVIAAVYCRSSENSLVVSPRNRERVKLNSLIHERLQRDGKVSRDDHQL